jgi:sigma-E factor negative regulatory protein RseC
MKWFSGGTGATLEIPARINDQSMLTPGQAVTIAVGDGEVLRAAATVYLPPLAGLLLGATAGSALGVAGEVGALLMASVGGIAGWAVARAWSRSRPPSVTVKPIDGEAA